jgi:nucleoside-diphosphate-sugar epimerase
MHAVIAGASGAVGAAIARELAATDTARVTGLARRAPSRPIVGVQYLQADLADAAECERQLAELPAATHLFYCARASHTEQQLEDVDTNVAMLEHILDALKHGGLRHVHLVQGGKVYGVHLGAFPTPAREDAARAPIPSFNYAQEDLLRERGLARDWTWSASRPNTLVHFAPANGRNLASSLGAYAALCRELGSAFDFPGPEAAYQSLTQITAIELLARGMHWMATDAACANQAFNLTNGDVFRWSTVWPQLAHAFGLPCGTVRPMRLAQTLADAGEVWERIVQRHQLQSLALDQVADWPYLDATLARTWDEILSTNKARSYGFHDWADSETQLLETLGTYQQANILP